METESLREAIGGTWFGAGLPSASLARLAELGRLRELGRGEVLLVEGAPTQELDLVLTGRVAVTAREPGRGEVTLMTVEPGDIVGWSVLLAPMPATATVRVIEPARVVSFAGAELRVALADDPVLAAAVHRQALDAVARRLMATRHQLLDLHAAPATESWSEPW